MSKISEHFAYVYRFNPRKMVRNIQICPRNYLKTPTELVRNFTTIEFAIVENHHTYHQTKKRPAQKGFGFTEFSLTIGKHTLAHLCIIFVPLSRLQYSVDQSKVGLKWVKGHF